MLVMNVLISTIHLRVDVKMNVKLLIAPTVCLNIIVLVVTMDLYLITIFVSQAQLFLDVRLSIQLITDFVRSARLDGL